MFGRKLNTEVKQWIVGGKVEPEKVRPFLLDGEKLVEGGGVIESRPLGMMGAGRVFTAEETVALRADPNLPIS